MANLESEKCRFKNLTRDEAGKIGKKGGIASAKKRREQKTFHELVQKAMSSMITGEETRNNLKAMGFSDEDLDNGQKAIYIGGLMNRAMSGDINAFKLLMELNNENDKYYDLKEKELEIKEKELQLKQQALDKGMIDKEDLPTFLEDILD